MDSQAAGPTSLAIIFAILTLPMMIFSAYVFIRFREDPFIRARSKFMTVFIWFFMLLVSYYQVGLSINVEPCLALMWTDNVFVGTLVWAVLIDCIRLLIIFNSTKSKFDFLDEGLTNVGTRDPKKKLR